jgi:hypothetical protein
MLRAVMSYVIVVLALAVLLLVLHLDNRARNTNGCEVAAQSACTSETQISHSCYDCIL